MARRMSSAIVDLTTSSDRSPGRRHIPEYIHVTCGPPSGQSSEQSTRQSPGQASSHPVHEPRGVKRRRPSDSTPGADSSTSSSSTARAAGNTDVEGIESVDLTEVNDESALAKALAKQREDAVKAQSSSEERKGRSILTSFKCPVCMDTPTDATSTICGMV